MTNVLNVSNSNCSTFIFKMEKIVHLLASIFNLPKKC
ncbi:Hypothetical protein AJF4211_003470 [Avibacterium paragallinarum JF4211]|nr:Hypothetical protein AJF4211_003470 [Avibacterium paragallinarum JF4211]